MKYHLTRFAPTPSGYLHLGNLFSFVLTAALAHKHGAEILLRIDDLDQCRGRPEYLEDIFDTLYFLGFSWQKGPKNLSEHEKNFSQVHRLPYYQESLSYLMQHNLVFACECSRKKIAQYHHNTGYPGLCTNKNLSFTKGNTALRVYTEPKTPISGITYPSSEFYERVPDDMAGFIVRKKDRMPSYQLSSMLDDTWFGVDLVVRGTDLYPSTLAQLYLSNLLPSCSSFKQTTFYHHPLLLDSDKKMAKSRGSTSIRHMRDQGMEASDIFIALGKRLGISQETSSLDNMISILARPQTFLQINQYLRSSLNRLNEE